MGLGDKFKDLAQQAKGKVAENREKIQEAVDAASVAVDEKTHGRYANKITKVNQKTGSALDKFGTGADADGAVVAPEQEQSVAVGDPARSADEAPVTVAGDSNRDATTQPTDSWPATGEAPKFDDEL